VQHLDSFLLEPVSDVDVLHPAGRDKDEGKRVQNLPIIGDVAVRDKPGHRLHTVSLRMEDQMRRVPPVPIRFKPAVVPLLFLGRLEVNGVDIDSDLLQSAVQQVSLGGHPPGLGG